VSPKTITEIIAKLSDDQREWLVKTGFKDLLSFTLTQVPHELAYKLVAAYNIETQSLELGDKKINITEKDVESVLGFPRGSNPLQFNQQTAAVRDWEAQFKDKTRSRIQTTDVTKKIKEEKTASENFKRSFLVMLGNTLIGQSKDAYAVRELAGIEGDLNKQHNYNWCTYVLAKLNTAIQAWHDKPTNPFTGPLLFLVVSIGF